MYIVKRGDFMDVEKVNRTNKTKLYTVKYDQPNQNNTKGHTNTVSLSQLLKDYPEITDTFTLAFLNDLKDSFYKKTKETVHLDFVVNKYIQKIVQEKHYNQTDVTAILKRHANIIKHNKLMEMLKNPHAYKSYYTQNDIIKDYLSNNKKKRDFNENFLIYVIVLAIIVAIGLVIL
jgi:hypothetical protein